ncbi:helix-turn-helix domain-containing protein [Mesorhizobium australicum]|uniref:helix-turn-helix domain-containing protein n=1 Tax=Mesorhizobium australicum TaxID=536018 RepID=UPI00333B3AF2
MNWTVRDLAEKSGVHRNTVTRIETEATAPGHSMAAVQAALNRPASSSMRRMAAAQAWGGAAR